MRDPGEPTKTHGKKISLTALLPPSLLVLLVLIFSHEMIFSDKIPLFRDLGPFFYPMRFSLAESISAGEFPLWDRHMGLGFPLLANFQSGAFYPPNLLYALLPFFTAIKAIFIFHYLVAASGAYFLLRHWRFTPPLALIGSLIFTFGGYTVSLTNLLNHFQTVVWLPWLLFLAEKHLASPNRINLILLVLMATVQFLAGSPEIYAMSMILFLFNGLGVRGEGRASYARIFASLIWVNTLVIGLAMVQLLPTLELLREAERTQASSLRWATDFSLQPISLLNLLFLDKEIDISSFDRFQFFFYRASPFLASLYMGSLFSFGLLAWIVSEDIKTKAIFLSGIVFSTLLSMGSHTPLYGLFYDYFPFISLIRFPEKFFFIPFVLLLYIALRGLSYLFKACEPRFFKVLLGPAIFCGLLLGLYFLCRSQRSMLPQFIAATTGIPSGNPLAWQISSSVLVHLERQIVLLLALLALLFLWQIKIIRRGLISTLIVAITFVDLYSAHTSYQFLIDRHIAERRPKMLDLLEDFPSFRVFFTSPQGRFHPDIAQFSNAKDPIEHVAFAFETLRPSMGIFWGVNYMQEVDALLRRPYSLFLRVAPNLPPRELYQLLGALSVKYLISLQELPAGPITLVRHFQEYPAWIYRVERVVPRAYIVPKAIYEKDPKKTIEMLAGSVDPLKEVIVDEIVELPAKGSFTGETEIHGYGNRSVSLRATLNRPGILVLSDSFYPGWKVYVDGVEGKIIRANYFLRGVYLQEGKHQVIFRYSPASFRYGMTVTLCTLILFLAFLMIRRKRRVSQKLSETS